MQLMPLCVYCGEDIDQEFYTACSLCRDLLRRESGSSQEPLAHPTSVLIGALCAAVVCGKRGEEARRVAHAALMQKRRVDQARTFLEPETLI